MTIHHWVTREFQGGDLALSGGDTLRGARLVYHQIGELNAPKDNIILLPTYYGGAARGNHPWVGGGSPLDPGRYCILVPAMLGAGESSSPANTAGPQGGADFPRVSLYDNVMLQRRLLEQVFADAEIALVMGWSMGGMQALQWASLFPQRIGAVLATCCSARCSPHNWLFLEGLRAALTCDPVFADGRYCQPPRQGLRAFARVYAGWAYSQEFFRGGGLGQLGFDSIADLLRFWEQDHLAQDANNLLAVLDTWQGGDISANPVFDGDLTRALAGITSPTRIMPCRTDLYFTADAAADEAAAMPGAQLEVIDSDWGHSAGGPGRNPAATRQVLAAARTLLDNREPS